MTPNFAKQFVSSGNANMAVGEEVTEYLLMRSIVDDQLQQARRSPVAASSSSECSFSFRVCSVSISLYISYSRYLFD